jgi:hypothetical protein
MFVHPNNWNGRNNLDKDELEDRLKDYDITIAKEGGTLVATVKRRNNNNDWKRSLSISFKFYTPRNVTTDLRTSGGSIHLSALAGNQRFRTSGGSLHLNDIEGSVNGMAVSTCKPRAAPSKQRPRRVNCGCTRPAVASD